MKKLGYILVCLCLVGTGWAGTSREEKTGTYPYSYSSWNKVLADVTFRNITDSFYAVFFYNGTLTLNNVGFESNTGRGLYMASYATISDMNDVDFLYNQRGGAHVAQNRLTMQDVSFNFNSASYGGGIYAPLTLGIFGDDIVFRGNNSDRGGAIYASDDLTIAGHDIQFNGNTATQNGGAIYSVGNVTLRADGGDIVFSGNSPNAIYLENANKTLSLQVANGGSIIFYDTLAAQNGSLQTNISGDGFVSFYKALSNANISVYDSNLYLDPSQNWQNVTLSVHDVKLRSNGSTVQHWALGPIALNGNLHLIPAVDFQAGLMDTFNISQTSGGGQIVVDGFNFITSPTHDTARTFNFMTGAGKNQVSVPQKTYVGIYAYQVDYNAAMGTLALTPIATTQIEGFNQAFIVQPIWSYTSAKLLTDSLRPLRSRARTRFLSCEDAPSSFYLTPYALNSKSTLWDVETKETIGGVQGGWDSADWAIFDHAAITGGFNVGYAQNAISYDRHKLDSTLYQMGANVRMYSGEFFGELTTQVGQVSGKFKTARTDTKSLAILARAEIGYNVNISSQEWFLRPWASYTQSRVDSGEEIVLASEVLTSEPLSLGQIEGGLTLLSTHEGLWHGYVDFSYIKPMVTQTDFYVGTELIPSLEPDPYAQISLGFQTESEGRFAWGLEINGNLGSTRAFGGNLTVQF